MNTAIEKLREAVRREDLLKYDEPPGWTVPSRHALGAFLLEARRFKEAEATYREDLIRYPENGWSLLGLSRALAGQQKRGEAEAVSTRQRKAWHRADIQLPASCLCVRPSRPDTPAPR